MTSIAEQLQKTGWLLRSGHGRGADQAFEAGTKPENKEIWVPYFGYNECVKVPHFHEVNMTEEVVSIAADHHPVWDKLQIEAKLLCARNIPVLLGSDLKTFSDLIIYWKLKSEHGLIDKKGGTNHTLRVARTYGIPSFNIAIEEDRHALNELIDKLERENQ